MLASGSTPTWADEHEQPRPHPAGLHDRPALRQRQASPHTVAAYRDAFKLLLVFAEQRTGKPPSKLEVADLDAPFIGAFLEHLEVERQTPSVHATRGWRRSIHFFAMPPSATLKTPPPSSAS